ncbi:MAG: hypothetical protein R2684_04320 [Pyrinomonadaceae bacterium]
MIAESLRFSSPLLFSSTSSLDYDDRQRVSHAEATSALDSGGYRLRADYNYSADSNLKEKDDLISNMSDRTYRRDFANRVTFEQFGFGVTSQSQQVRVFEQTIEYDGFSIANDVYGNHWETLMSYGGNYANGRIVGNGSNIVYDESGNITHTAPGSNAAFDFQNTAFDAAGRKTSFHSSVRGRMGSRLNMVTETKQEFEYDGNGRPVSEKSGIEIYHESTQNPPDPVPVVLGYQLWSTVTGNTVTGLTPTGSSNGTTIYAGEARLGVLSASGSLVLGSADPVTGTKISYQYSGVGGRTEISLLGQRIESSDPNGFPDPIPNEIVSYWENMERSCELQQGWGEFNKLPFHCQLKIAMNSSAMWSELSWEESPKAVEKANRAAVTIHTHEHAHQTIMMEQALKSSAKPLGGDKKEDETEGDGSTGSDDKSNDGDYSCDYGKDGSANNCSVNVANEGGWVAGKSPSDGNAPLNDEENNKLDGLIKDLLDSNLVKDRCKQWLIEKLGVDGYTSLIETLNDKGLRYSGTRSTISVEDSGIFPSDRREKLQALADGAENPNYRASFLNEIANLDMPLNEWLSLTAENKRIRAIVSYKTNAIYYVTFDSKTTVLHENMHLSTGLNDVDLAAKLGITENEILDQYSANGSPSAAISKKLKDRGCTN